MNEKTSKARTVKDSLTVAATAAPVAQGESVAALRERLGAAHDASLDDDHRACRDILMEVIRELDAAPAPQPVSEQAAPRAPLTGELLAAIRARKDAP